jgi:hypothetical protein
MPVAVTADVDSVVADIVTTSLGYGVRRVPGGAGETGERFRRVAAGLPAIARQRAVGKSAEAVERTFIHSK